MDVQIKKIGKNIADFWKNLGKKLKIIIIASACVILIAAIVLTILLNRTEYVVLFSQLDDTEITEVLSKLQEGPVDYKVQKNGDILVPKNQEALLRMQLAQEGYPKTGYNYETFSKNIDFMTTDYEKRVYYTYDLQEKIQAAIKSINGVKNALVTIGKPDNNNYAWDANREDMTASVKIETKPGYELNNSQIEGILKLVQTSVVGLKESNISLIDNDGNDLTKQLGVRQTDTLRLKLDIEAELERDVEENVRKILEKGFGQGTVEVSAKCSINLDKKISENLQYTPNGDTNAGVISSKDKNIEIVGEGQVNGGVVGTENNSEIPIYPEVTIDGNNIYYKDNDSIEYLVSQLKEQIQYEPGYIESMTVAVILNKDKVGQTEREDLINLIAHSAGTSPENVALHNMKFYEPVVEIFDDKGTFKGFTDKELLIIAIVAAILLIIIIVVVIILRKRAKKRRELEEELAAQEAEANKVDWELPQDEIEIKETKEVALKKQISEFVSSNPEIAAQLIRTWIKGEDD